MVSRSRGQPSEWLRRVTFDLTGLPPLPEEIMQFERDRSPDALERVVDRLLASPRYGERWGQHWLDVVRFAETRGLRVRPPPARCLAVPRLRDRSLNRDKPFDRFLTEQIAGDELAPDDAECQTASIFHRLGPVRRNAGNPEIALSRNEVLTERTDIIGTAFLGLTVGCARCHDHKLEPIPQKDYYRLQAYLAATDEHDIVLAAADEQQAWEAKTKRIEGRDQAAAERRPSRRRRRAGEARREQIEALEDQLPPPLPTIPGTRNDFDKRTPIHVLQRGVWENKGEAGRPASARACWCADDLPELPADVAEPADAPGPLADVARASADGPGDGQSHLAAPLRHRARRDGQRLRRHGATAQPSGTARLAGGDARRKRLAAQAAAPADRAEQHLSPVEPIRRCAGRRPMQSDPENRLLWHFNRRRLRPKRCATRCSRSPAGSTCKAGGPSVMVPVDPELVQSALQAVAVGSHGATRPSTTGARST